MATHTSGRWAPAHRRAARGSVRLLAAGLSAVSLVVSAAVPAFAAPSPTPSPPAPANATYQLTGSGTASNISIAPTPDFGYGGKLPWSASTTIDPSVKLLRLSAVAIGASNVGCRITLDGQVVAEQPPGVEANCVFTRS